MENVNKLIYTYSLVKALYEQGKDYIDSFWPFVLKVMPKDKTSLNLAAIQKGVKDNFGLDIPEHSLTTIVTRAKRKSYLKQQGKQLRLTTQGDMYLDSLEPEPEVEQRINELLEDVKNHLNEELELSLATDETYTIVLSFIHKNISSVVEFFDPDSSIIQLDLSKPKINKYEGALVNYFKVAQKNSPRLYTTLIDIVYGSVISTTASSRGIAEINKRFARTQIFFDSNYLFSLLGLHFPEFHKPAKELSDLLKSYKFDLRAFDFTIDEMVGVLKNYSREQHLYIPGVRVGTIYSNLKNKGWTIEDVKEFIGKIEEKIWQLGIKIESTHINLKDYKPSEGYPNKLSQYKPGQNVQNQNHDLAAIEEIKEIRGSPKREIENSKALFLTSDWRLSKFNFLEMGHREKLTVCEVIPDKLLTNILWLKNPTTVKDIPLKSIIAIHAGGMFINRKIWERFCKNIKKLKEDSSINNKDVSMLFYNRHIEKVLEVYDNSEIDEITPDFILGEIQTVGKRIDEKTKKELQKQRKLFEKELTQGELKKVNHFEIKLNKIKQKLKTSATQKAKTIANTKMCLPIFPLIVIFIYCILAKKSGIIVTILISIAAVTAILSYFGIKANIFKIREHLQDKAFQKIYRKKLRRLALEETFDNHP